jgi:orotidine-5'-phosphate decarboxylase
MSVPSEKIMVALDVSDKCQALRLLDQLSAYKIWIKIGMEAFYSWGPDIVYEGKKRGFKIFLDLKLHDIPNTVGKSIKTLIKLPIDMINIHAAGGSEMMKRANESLMSSQTPPLLIAVTQLTSTTTEQMNKEQGISGSLLENVLLYAKLSKESGCHGVVCSPHEVKTLKNAFGDQFITVTPGIRPFIHHSHDQKRVMTPLEAHLCGTDYMVIGRPITEASDPKEALETILNGASE